MNIKDSSVSVTLTDLTIDDVKMTPASHTIAIPTKVGSRPIGDGEVLRMGVKRKGVSTFEEDEHEHPLKVQKSSSSTSKGGCKSCKGRKGKRGR